MKNKKNNILIAEDEEFNRMYMEELFSDSPYNIIEAKDGEQAIIKFKQHKNVDLVLMDIRMPRIGGVEAMKAIKKLSPHTPVIALSAAVMEIENEEIMGKGFDGYLSKPINKKKLFELIDLTLCK